MGAVEDSLNKFGKYVVQQSKSNLTRKDIKDTSALYSSINYVLKVSRKQNFELTINMEDYGSFVDKGVKGVGGVKADGSSWKLKKVTNSTFKYRDKMPPPSVFNGWTIRKKIAPRSEGGRFTSRKSIMYSIAKSIYHTGLETTNFITTPFERAFKRLPDEIVESYALDMDKFFESTKKNARI